MPRCKALVRGGSRRCRRQALKGQSFCSIHGGVGSRRAGSTRSPSHSKPVGGRAPRAPSRNTGASLPVHKGYYRTIRNPNFGPSDVLHHWLDDKTGDIAMRMQIQSEVMKSTIPIKAAMIFGLTPMGAFFGGIALDQALTQLIWSQYLTYDKIRDFYNVLTTQEIGGKRIYAHEYVTNSPSKNTISST